jgi:hypothetical protein
MKRLRRIIFNGLTAVSLLLCVGTVGQWVRSYWVTQFVGWSGSTKWAGMLSMGGLLRLERGSHPDTPLGWSYIVYPTPAGGLWSEAAARDRHGGRLRRCGFAYARIDYTSNGGMVRQALYMPHWSMVVLLAVVPALWIWQASHGQCQPGFCTICGYDLRATPDRCPECGMLPGKVKA